MNELKMQIRCESSKAAQLSQEAQLAFARNDWGQGKALMVEAVAASQNCQKLIQKLTSSVAK